MEEPETWADHPDFRIRVSNHGRVEKNGKISQISVRKDGYRVTSTGGRGFPIRRVARLVLETFEGPCPVGKTCRHIDGNSQNDHLGNLAWGTDQEQIADQKRHGTFSPPPRGDGRANGQYKGVFDSESMTQAIAEYTNGGVTSRVVANKYGVSKTHLLRHFHRSGQKEVGGHG